MRISDWSSDVCSSDLAKLLHQLGVGVQISEHQHLADVGVLISAAADSRKATAEAAAAACAERQVRFAGIAFGQPLLLGRACVDQRQRDIGFLLLDVDSARDRAKAAKEAPAKPAQHAAKIGRAHVWTPVTNAPLVC